MAKTIIEVFSIWVLGEGRRSLSFAHRFRHWNYFFTANLLDREHRGHPC
jgi:hypothetical protein